MQEYLKKIEQGFQKLSVSDKYQQAALDNLKVWLQDSQFKDYQPQLLHLIDTGCFELLLDSFYQVLPFGTGGRRGPVGIGPNRLNPWTIQASAQGHSDYLLQMFGEQAKQRGLVICYDVRKFPPSKIFNEKLANPVRDITSRDIAVAAALVYAANGIKCYLFEGIRSTPELSFAVRYKKAVAGVVISASHNPKEDNGKKVYSADGGQLVPPEDQKLSDVVNGVKEIKRFTLDEARKRGLIDESFSRDTDQAYLKAVSDCSLLGKNLDKQHLTIAYSPLHGVGMTSVYQVLTQQGFKVVLDELTASADGFFPNVKFYIPNPEVIESMETLVVKGKQADADLLVNSDPDADRLGLMARTSGNGATSAYRYFAGNEIGILLTHFMLDRLQAQKKMPAKPLMAKTGVTTELIAKIAKHYGVEIIGDLLVGFKYIGNIVKQLEAKGETSRFVLGMEESHGFLIGTYSRDKDAAGAALVLCEAACYLKQSGKNLAQYLDDIYQKFGYHSNKQTSLIFLGAEGKGKIDKITAAFRANPPKQVGQFKVVKFVDRWQGEPILSPTDESSRNMLTFMLEPPHGVDFIKLTVRPSGTEPKIKLYIEVGGKPLAAKASLAEEQAKIHRVMNEAMQSFTGSAYAAVGIEMPPRGLKLSNLLPVETKLKYFDVERELLSLEGQAKNKTLTPEAVNKRVDELLAVFGKDPVEKISAAFQEQAGVPLKSFLQERLGIVIK